MAKINEVAKAAGVSISTVSYALSGKRPVAPATRKRIQQAVESLGYRPNAGARMLAGSRTHIFALTEPLRPDTHAPTHMAFVLAAAVAARRADYDLLLLTDEQASAGMGRVASSRLVDAILVLDVAPDDARVALSRTIDVPTVFIGIPDDREGLICVDFDFEAAAALAVDRLADAGHQHIGLLGQPDVAYERSNFPRRLRRAAQQRAAERGIHLSFRSSGHTRVDAAAAAHGAHELLDAGATALLLHGADDLHAAVLADFAERGVSIPQDVSVISVATSFDMSTLAVPVDVIPLRPEASCDLAVELALRCLDAGRVEPGLHLLPARYIDRGSVLARTSVQLE